MKILPVRCCECVQATSAGSPFSACEPCRASTRPVREQMCSTLPSQSSNVYANAAKHTACHPCSYRRSCASAHNEALPHIRPLMRILVDCVHSCSPNRPVALSYPCAHFSLFVSLPCLSVAPSLACTRWRGTAVAAHVRAMEPVLPGI